MSQVSSFKPIVDERSRILILGSIPGVESLRLQEYYANPRNQFWKLIYAHFELEPSECYEERVSFVKSKGIALWDVIGNCLREGSLDSAIREEKVNNFRGLFKAYPGIEIVLFNGGKAYETYKKWVGFKALPNITFLKLTSSSPANTKKYEEKLREWGVIKEFLKSG
ncbi:DNA-deoxyinosine glycosylase [Desulfosporosinus nitroreducens]|uniref:DNA-deoxyinosine glycosylase n=1 Tax=Desulfosporosinus nitroreducens TaxID=2018668 RepID=A0ABT8QUQ8_9FIRM|nr:DNA-deoxyinosine glycosylase [Desulfosporosinus nitroreducens]MDO0825086.1 DNA-deoxyinosine glycosylase [Desulfosporosinus nitroreducens]